MKSREEMNDAERTAVEDRSEWTGFLVELRQHIGSEPQTTRQLADLVVKWPAVREAMPDELAAAAAAHDAKP